MSTAQGGELLPPQHSIQLNMQMSSLEYEVFKGLLAEVIKKEAADHAGHSCAIATTIEKIMKEIAQVNADLKAKGIDTGADVDRYLNENEPKTLSGIGELIAMLLGEGVNSESNIKESPKEFVDRLLLVGQKARESGKEVRLMLLR